MVGYVSLIVLILMLGSYGKSKRADFVGKPTGNEDLANLPPRRAEYAPQGEMGVRVLCLTPKISYHEIS